LQSVVTDIQKIVDTEIKLPTGYYVEYGGQFENLQSAKARLMIAVPPLFLIFILLYFAFGSIKEALMVYSAIPLSAVGGVLFFMDERFAFQHFGRSRVYSIVWYRSSKRNSVD
jgi:cobalt-zinc-cadmium resistance protein CzcA